MTTLLILCAIAAVCFVLFELRKLRQGNIPPETVVEELDLEALSNLIDDRQSEFVRAQVSSSEYKRYQRSKAKVLLAYLGVMSDFLETRIRSLSAPANEAAVSYEQLDLFVHSRQLVLRAQMMIWLFLVIPSGAQLLESAQQQCRALTASLRNDLLIARASEAS